MVRPSDKHDPVSANLRMALELQRAGFSMMRQNLRLRYPEESDSQIDRRFRDWVKEHPLLGISPETLRDEATIGSDP